MYRIEKSVPLSAGNIDSIAEDVMKVCGGLKIRKDQSLKIRLIVEDALAIWMDTLGEGTEVEVRADTMLFRPYLEILCRSDRSCNPLAVEDSGFFTESILKTVTVSPDFIYRQGKNILHFNMNKQEKNPLIKLLIVLIVALLIGFGGVQIIPKDIITIIQTNFISPTYSKFMDVLRCIAGPLVFFSVTWGIYGIGDTSALSKLGKGVILRNICGVFIAAVCCVVFFPIFGCTLTEQAMDFKNLFSIYTMLLDMFPVSIVTPFSTGNTMQIIVLAVCVGIALIYLGKKTQAVAFGIEQFNLVTTFLMTAISKLVPISIIFVMINMIWSDSFSVMAEAWKFLLALVCALVSISVFTLVYTAVRYKVRPSVLLRKILPAYVIAFVTASSSAAFGTIFETCEKKFGINKSLTGFGVPLGIVTFPMSSAINAVLLVFYIAKIKEIPCSVSWIVMAVIVSGITAIATPPIPGGATVAYTALFMQLGLPEDSLAIALALDMLSDFMITATNIFCLPFGLADIAARYDLLDIETLRK